jgi:alkylation response protein AidB-like acyl-CoA dehydrogenase
MDADEVRYPREYVQKAAARNLLGMRFDPKYGGRGLPWTAEVAAIAEVGVLGSSLSCLYVLPSIIGEALHVFGTEEQKQKYLVPTLKGELCCAEALTEPRGGSDFFGATTKAEKSGDGYVLNGHKRFIVGAEGADYFLVYAKTDPEAPPHESISLFIVERDMGVDVQHVYGLMGTRGGGTGRIVFRDTIVPVENLIGQEGDGGRIFNQMMLPERLTSAAGVIGTARAALEVAASYSRKRHAFGKPISKFQAVSFKIAASVSKLDAASALAYAAARTIDLGRPARRIVSEAKKVATETAWEVVNDAMQVMGGIGYTNVYPIERFLRDMRLCMIWTGTSEIMQLLIQHEYYEELADTIAARRNVEDDAVNADETEEKVFE